MEIEVVLEQLHPEFSCITVSVRNRRFHELYTLTNSIGKSTKIHTKTYSAPKTTYTRKAHYATKLAFSRLETVWLRLSTLQQTFP